MFIFIGSVMILNLNSILTPIVEICLVFAVIIDFSILSLTYIKITSSKYIKYDDNVSAEEIINLSNTY